MFGVGNGALQVTSPRAITTDPRESDAFVRLVADVHAANKIFGTDVPNVAAVVVGVTLDSILHVVGIGVGFVTLCSDVTARTWRRCSRGRWSRASRAAGGWRFRSGVPVEIESEVDSRVVVNSVQVFLEVADSTQVRVADTFGVGITGVNATQEGDRAHSGEVAAIVIFATFKLVGRAIATAVYGAGILDGLLTLIKSRRGRDGCTGGRWNFACIGWQAEAWAGHSGRRQRRARVLRSIARDH
jgi:hypothetical protein